MQSPHPSWRQATQSSIWPLHIPRPHTVQFRQLCLKPLPAALLTCQSLAAHLDPRPEILRNPGLGIQISLKSAHPINQG
uniref:Uncharacterized protein n=1 Tax=Arundo donax TaxID=35708 RepID=A0A0A9FQB3_ARUDO